MKDQGSLKVWHGNLQGKFPVGKKVLKVGQYSFSLFFYFCDIPQNLSVDDFWKSCEKIIPTSMLLWIIHSKAKLLQVKTRKKSRKSGKNRENERVITWWTGVVFYNCAFHTPFLSLSPQSLKLLVFWEKINIKC